MNSKLIIQLFKSNFKKHLEQKAHLQLKSLKLNLNDVSEFLGARVHKVKKA